MLPDGSVLGSSLSAEFTSQLTISATEQMQLLSALFSSHWRSYEKCGHALFTTQQTSNVASSSVESLEASEATQEDALQSIWICTEDGNTWILTSIRGMILCLSSQSISLGMLKIKSDTAVKCFQQAFEKIELY